MKPAQDRENDEVEGFGYHHGDGITADPVTTNGVAQGKRKTVSFSPLCGILRQTIPKIRAFAGNLFGFRAKGFQIFSDGDADLVKGETVPEGPTPEGIPEIRRVF